MTITWYGHSCFKIDNQGGHLTIITDPFDKKIGLTPPRGNADIITISHNHYDHNNVKAISGEPFVIETPGEYEVKEIRILGVPGYHDNEKGKERGINIIYLIKIDGIKICHLGDMGQEKLTDKQLELINDVDILMIPVGGVYTIDAKKAVKIIKQIEPSIIIPMHYKLPGLTEELAKVDGVLVVSHVKGHICSGFGGAVKNLGMGALTKKTKSEIHAGGEPVFSGECRRCKACEKACPLGTLKVDDTPIFRTCYGCSNCVYACEYGLIKPKIAVFDKLLAEGANAAQSTFKKKYYINLVFRITTECDCEKDPGRIIGKDCGIIFGEDGVAVDKASHDLICKISGEDVFLKWNKKSGVEHIRQAEQAGMGSMKYEMEEV